MNFFIVKVGLESSVAQPDLMDLLSQAGCEAIQTSDGLCVKTPMALNEIQNLKEELKSLHFQNVDPKKAGENLSPDVQKFISGS